MGIRCNYTPDVLQSRKIRIPCSDFTLTGIISQSKLPPELKQYILRGIIEIVYDTDLPEHNMSQLFCMISQL